MHRIYLKIISSVVFGSLFVLGGLLVLFLEVPNYSHKHKCIPAEYHPKRYNNNHVNVQIISTCVKSIKDANYIFIGHLNINTNHNKTEDALKQAHKEYPPGILFEACTSNVNYVKMTKSVLESDKTFIKSDFIKSANFKKYKLYQNCTSNFIIFLGFSVCFLLLGLGLLIFASVTFLKNRNNIHYFLIN